MNTFGVWLFAVFALSMQAPASASPLSWHEDKGQWSLELNLSDTLTAQQKKLLFSGFSTFSHLEVRMPEASGMRLLFVSECSIQYDLWEEKFDLLYFLEAQHPEKLRSFKDYSDLCLAAALRNADTLRALQSPGQHLEVHLDIAQVSSEFAKNVREWLIQQQSGMMRGLFAHMLGELKMKESLTLDLSLPALPAQRGAPHAKP